MAGIPWDKVYLPEGPSHYEWLKQNCTKYNKQQIAEKLGRSVTAVSHKLFHEGWQALDDLPVIQGTEVVLKAEGVPVDALLKAIRDEPRSLRELSAEFDRSETTIRKAIEHLRELSYEITQTERRGYLWSTESPGIVAPPTTLWDKDVWKVKFGVISDTQIASKAAQISALIKAIDIMYKQGVKDVLFCGDLVAGYGVYRGQEMDLVTTSADEQAKLVTTYWPKHNGMHFYMMGGNHDWSFIRSAGFNVVKAACKQRTDFTYVGFNVASIPLTQHIDALMWHPSGGVPYAVSYRAQKMAEQVAMEQLTEVLEKNATPRVRFLFAGHLHIMVEFWQGPIFVAQVGCFEGQTDYLKRKALYPQIGCLILEGEVTKDRSMIRELCVRHLRFTEIENDYLNYPVPQESEEEIEPLFQWKQ